MPYFLDMRSDRKGNPFLFLRGRASDVAPQLLGCILMRTLHGKVIRARIVEVEAYDENDIASHSYKGKTKKTEVMFGEAGILYVYFTYGMHYCCNVVVEPKGRGSAVLIRALQPIDGEASIRLHRNSQNVYDLTNGPAKLCQALAINRTLNGHDLSKPPLQLVIERPLPLEQIVQTTRIGISQAKDVPWRFYIKNNPYVSKL